WLSLSNSRWDGARLCRACSSLAWVVLIFFLLNAIGDIVPVCREGRSRPGRVPSRPLELPASTLRRGGPRHSQARRARVARVPPRPCAWPARTLRRGGPRHSQARRAPEGRVPPRPLELPARPLRRGGTRHSQARRDTGLGGSSSTST